MDDDLYERDIALWSTEQARVLRDSARAHSNLPVDWENVADEIESVGRSQRTALSSHIATVLEHLIKLQASPADEPRGGWVASVLRARGEIDQLLRDSPSLRPSVSELVASRLPTARRAAVASMAQYRETARVDVAGLDYTDAQVVGDWWPEDA
jgi:hypothetical protein